MANGNGSAGFQPKALIEIAERLAAITPEQFIPPEVSRGKGDNFVCVASDDIKRLFTLKMALHNECKALTKKGKQILFARTGKITPEDRSEVDRLEAELSRLSPLSNIADEMFWYEARQQEDLASKASIGIRSDWSICWFEKEESDSGIDLPLDALLGLGIIAVKGRCGDPNCTECGGGH